MLTLSHMISVMNVCDLESLGPVISSRQELLVSHAKRFRHIHLTAQKESGWHELVVSYSWARLQCLAQTEAVCSETSFAIFVDEVLVFTCCRLVLTWTTPFSENLDENGKRNLEALRSSELSDSQIGSLELIKDIFESGGGENWFFQFEGKKTARKSVACSRGTVESIFIVPGETMVPGKKKLAFSQTYD